MAEVVMVGALVVVLVLGLVQLALALWVRTALIDAAAEGARTAAMYDGDLAAGTDRALEVVGMSLTPGYAESATARVESGAGYDVVVVEVRAPLPVIGLLGPSGSLTATGRAVAER
ncbi:MULTISPECIES: TadE/TadG family type IV pilus assembly protein [Miniimonas]|nr:MULTISPECIES: TadE/TadG family type IV pilus assembly protein [Miniimonas]